MNQALLTVTLTFFGVLAGLLPARPASAANTNANSVAAEQLRGAKVDRGDFDVSRTVSEAPPGIARIQLDADVLARSHELNDVRIVNAANEQIPYIAEKLPDPLIVPLSVPRAQSRGRQSVYRIHLPYDTLPNGTILELTTSAKVFSRQVTLMRPADEKRGDSEVQLAAEEWRSLPEGAVVPLDFTVALQGLHDVELIVDEGDNAPLPIKSAQLVMKGLAIRFYNPGTPLTLLYGNRELAPPQYDLQLLAPRIYAAPARELTLSAPAQNRAHKTLPSRGLFWIAVAAVAVILLVLLIRLLTGHAAAAAQP